MSLKMPWFRKGEGEYNSFPLSYRAWMKLWQQGSRFGRSSNLFDRIERTEWDLLILLDACRFDTLFDIVDWYVVEKAITPETTTSRFLQHAQSASLFDNCVYVSGNPQSGKHGVGEVNKHVPMYDEGWDRTLSTVPPEPIYDRAKEFVREGESVVAHTIQPHYPHICEIEGEIQPVPNGLHPAELEFDYNQDLKIQSILARGLIDLEAAKKSYEICTRFAWHQASRTALELAAEGYTVAITADHAELFGEYGFVEHPTDVPIKKLQEVPWIVIDNKLLKPPDICDVTDRLAALGYVNK